MAKYSFELKKEVVMVYLNGGGSYKCLAERYGIASKTDVKKWINNYRAFGDDGLIRSRKNDIYSFEKKLFIVESYLTSEVSYQDLALQEGIRNPAQIVKWVNDFRIAGPDALRPKKKGRKKTMDTPDKKPKVQSTDSTPVDTSAEHVKELEDELLKLRIENAYLKELRRLRLEEEALLKKQREPSTVSEENSN